MARLAQLILDTYNPIASNMYTSRPIPILYWIIFVPHYDIPVGPVVLKYKVYGNSRSLTHTETICIYYIRDIIFLFQFL